MCVSHQLRARLDNLEKEKRCLLLGSMKNITPVVPFIQIPYGRIALRIHRISVSVVWSRNINVFAYVKQFDFIKQSINVS